MSKSVLITGVAGFLGVNLLETLLRQGYRVVGLDDLSHGQWNALTKLQGDGFDFVRADVRDVEAVVQAAQGVDYVIHFAESKMARYGSSLETLETNVRGTESALIAARKHDAKLILGSTEEVYGKNPDSPLNEESFLVFGHSGVNRWSLGASKAMAEQLCFAHAEKYGIHATVLRYFAGYGPHQSLDWRGGPVPVFVHAALRQEKSPIHGDGRQVRTLTSGHDLVAGTLLAMQTPHAANEIVNVASRDSISIVNLAYLVWRLCEVPQKPQFEFVPYTDFSRNYEDVRCRTADISKAHYLLGYQPEVTLEEGIRETIAWQRAAMDAGHERCEQETSDKFVQADRAAAAQESV